MRTKTLDCSQHPFLSGAAWSVWRENYIYEAKKRPRSFERERLFFAIILFVLLRLHLQQLQIHLLQQQELQLLRQLRQREQQLLPNPQQIAVLIAAFLLR